MIEAEYADRLGFCLSHRADDHDRIEAALARVVALGIRHLRVSLGAQDLERQAWLSWMLPRLATEAEILVSLDAVPGSTAEGGALDCLLQRHGAHFSAVELRDAGDDVALRQGAALVRARGTTVVIGLARGDCGTRIARLGAQGVLDGECILGITQALAWPDLAALDDDIAALRSCRARYNPAAPIWLTQAGLSTWRHELAIQAQAFLHVLGMQVPRVYWQALADDADADTRDRDGHFGIDDASGEPKLLGRLLGGGIAGVEGILALSRRLPAPAIVGTKPVLVTGGAGFIGANLADRLAADGHHVVIYDALARPGVERNLRWLARRHPARVSFQLGDLRDEPATAEMAASAEAVFHLAGQVAVTTSMARPLDDFEVNARGTIALLDALRRRNPHAPLVFASTNKVYGDLADIDLVREGECYLPQRPEIRMHGVSESRPLCFHTPYGCSKGTADQYVLDYAHSFGLRTAVLRMSCIYGERQLGTEDQGWVAHFLLRAIAGAPITIYGDGRQVRDILHVGDAVSAYLAAWQNIDEIAGRAYNLGGGPANAISLRALIAHIEAMLGRPVDVAFSEWRPGDQRYFVADTTAIRRDLGLAAPLGWRSGLARLAEHFGAIPAEVAHEAAL